MSIGNVKYKKIALIIFGVLIFSNILVWLVVYDLSKPKLLEVTFFDVGQGDSIFIETPKRRQILIDGGPDAAILAKLAKEMSFYDRTIDLIILTHPEKDHLAGLLEVLKRYKVRNILWTGVVRDTAEWQEWIRLIKNEKANIGIARAGQQIVLPAQNASQAKRNEAGGPGLCKIDILYPFEDLGGKEVKNSNNASIVSRLDCANDSFLFTGDIEKSAEREIIEKNVSISADVLKVGHHGSKTSSTKEFLEKVLPKIAVIQAGRENSYGHPHQEVLANLEQFGIDIKRTDLDGDIKVISNGNNLQIVHPVRNFKEQQLGSPR